MKIYIVQRTRWSSVTNLTAFTTFDKALDYLNYVKELYKESDYNFEIESLQLEGSHE